MEKIKKLLKAIGDIFAFLRRFIANILVLVVLGIVVVAIFSPLAKPGIANQTILKFNPSGVVVEAAADVAFSSLLPAQAIGDEISVSEIVETIDTAAKDPRIVVLSLDFEKLYGANLVQVAAIGEALSNFKSTGKPILAYGTSFSQSQYVLTSHADEIYMHPMGQLLFPGFAFSTTYYKNLLSRLKVETHVFSVGSYKTAVEPYTRSTMSDEAKESYGAILDQIWAEYRRAVVSNKVEETVFDEYTSQFDRLLVENNETLAGLAHSKQFLDGLMSQTDFDEMVDARFKEISGKETVKRISFNDYYTATQESEPSIRSNTIGYVVAQGGIISSSSATGVIGDKWLEILVRDARKNDDIKALVLRIDSPGGSAFASEQIRLELERFTEAGKPLVVSMAGVAASGGYWIASAADVIVASESTITGSIGVFSIVPRFADSLSSVGINTESVQTTPFANWDDPMARLTPRMATVFQHSVDEVYRQFVQIVSESRNKTVEEIESIAQGRIWTGSDALAHGLVDMLGDFDDALSKAAELAELSDYNVVRLKGKPEKSLPPIESLISNVLKNSGSLGAFGEVLTKPLDSILLNRDPANVYAFCLTCDVAMP